MIILYENNEKNFTSLGVGILGDAISCIVLEGLNGSFELEMEYPISGQHFNDITLNRIIFAKPNMYDNPQPFRIYEITKPLNGVITVKAEHISYDMRGYTVKAFKAINLDDALLKIQNGSLIENDFTFETDKTVTTEMEIDHPYNMRSLLAGSNDSLLGIYGGEFKFDKFNISLLNKRGADRGVSIRYGKNMTDLEHEINSEKMFTGVFPFYFAINNETQTQTVKYFVPVYIVSGAIPISAGWFSLTDGGKAFPPIIHDSPVQIKSQGSYLNEVYSFSSDVLKHGVQTLTAYVRIVEEGLEFSNSWLSLTDGGEALTPKPPIEGECYSVSGKIYIWDNSANLYKEYDGGGFYYKPSPTPNAPLTRSETITQQRKEYVDLTTARDVYIVEGATPFSRGWFTQLDGGGAFDPKDFVEMGNIYIVKTDGEYLGNKYEWVEDDESYVLFTGNGIIYIDEDAELQRILTLDLTSVFSEKPPVPMLKIIADAYILNNEIGKIKEITTVSFVKLADSLEYVKYAELEKVMLGDTVKVIYERLGVETKLDVISTEFNVLTEKYNEIELGKKAASMADNTLSNGDSISALTNDVRYADYTTVNNLIAKIVTAEYIQASNAHLTTAQIEELSVTRIRCAGIIEASIFDIDKVVSKLLTVDDAEIKNVLKAGTVEVRGTIYADAGVIGGAVIEVIDGESILTIDKINVKQQVCVEIIQDAEDEIMDIVANQITAEYIESFELSADIIKGGTISASEIYIGKQIIDAYIIGSVTPLSSGWLTSGGIKSINDSGTIHLPSGGYLDSGLVFTYEKLFNATIYINGSPVVINGTAQGSVYWIASYYGFTLNYPNAQAPSIHFMYDNGQNVETPNYIWDEEHTGPLEVRIKFDDPDENIQIIPDSSKYYRIKSQLEYSGISYFDNYYYWDWNIESYRYTSTLKKGFYVDLDGNISVGQDLFRVNDLGEVFAKSLQIETTEESNSSININNAFRVNSDGKVFVDYIRVLDEMEVEEIRAKIIKMNDVELQYISGSTLQTETQTLYISSDIISVNYNMMQDVTSITFGIYSKKTGTLTTSWENISVQIKAEYREIGSGTLKTINTTGLIDTGDHTGSKMVHVFGEIYDLVIIEVIPGSVIQIRSASQPAISINAHFMPSEDGVYQLGGPDNLWTDIYAENSIIQTSDERLKKEIDYDISNYELFFDRLKPASYKFKSGKSDRVHLGLIAQDVRDILEECNMTPKDFAGYIRNIKEESMDKENFTEDDYVYGLRYSELHALQIYEIQKLKKHVSILEARLKNLEEKIREN